MQFFFLFISLLFTCVFVSGKQNAGVAPTVTNIAYGDHEKEKMNFWKYDCSEPVGILLDIHGGGWMGGKKSESKHPSQLQKGYHLASISYPLVNEGGRQPQMLHAALRAVQFL